jgi:hypothetical protein
MLPVNASVRELQISDAVSYLKGMSQGVAGVRTVNALLRMGWAE